MDLIKNMLDNKSNLAEMLFSMHGGAKGFDLWLVKTADFLAKHKSVPSEFAPLVSQLSNGPPLEMIDMMIESLDNAGAWQFKINQSNGISQVIDLVSGDIVEESHDLQSMIEKYKVKTDG
jgi:hypothetical protein